MTHSSTRAGRGPTEPRDGHARDETGRTGAAEQRSGDRTVDRAADRSTVGWRYGSALAAARALNARPARA